MMRPFALLLLMTTLVSCATQPDKAVFSKAIAQRDQEVIADQLEAGFDINARIDDQRNTPLHQAVATGNYTLVEYLTQKGANPFARNVQAQSPIDLALAKYDTFKAWAEKQIDVGRPDFDLALAKYDTFKAWAEKQIDVGRPNFDLAVEAIKKSDTQRLNQLIQEESFYLYTKLKKNGDLLLHFAVQLDCLACVETLMQAQFDPNRDSNGWTPLMSAVKTGQLPLVERLLKARADVNLKDEVGRNALHFTASKYNEGGDERQADIAKVLIAA
jgi:hypothetical protein